MIALVILLFGALGLDFAPLSCSLFLGVDCLALTSILNASTRLRGRGQDELRYAVRTKEIRMFEPIDGAMAVMNTTQGLRPRGLAYKA
jgi:hypothetical protein